MKTYSTKAADIKRQWHVLDAADKVLGRLATEAAVLLMGKHKPSYAPHLDMGDFVIVVNAARVRLTGRKAEQKMYYRHSGYPGGLREIPFTKMMQTHPERVIEHAVKGMLPHNARGRALLRHLKVYAGPTHPHEAQIKGQDRAEQTEAKEA